MCSSQDGKGVNSLCMDFSRHYLGLFPSGDPIVYPFIVINLYHECNCRLSTVSHSRKSSDLHLLIFDVFLSIFFRSTPIYQDFISCICFRYLDI